MNTRDYLTRNIERIPCWRYHLEKPTQTLLIAAVLAGCGIPSLLAVIGATLGYLFIGKWINDSPPSKDWIADGIIGAFAIAAERLLVGDSLGWWLLLILAVLYYVVVLRLRWAHP